MMRLRVHHLLCSALYVGRGYSEAFCENMQRVAGWLWEPLSETEKDRGMQGEPEYILCEGEQREVRLVTGPDNICRECPNLADNGCRLDRNNVVSKDAALAQALGLETGRVYRVPELLHIVGRNLTAEIFEGSCQNCEWYRKGLCRYEPLMRKYQSAGPAGGPRFPLDI
ncbi:MAG: DUF1284 domain-containing protein [Blautia sp.]|nr:DUF1284 domain-containing protein [Blautia sp.]MCM1201810.1 DUF1284 domain-containing protein [Bacteroides fragilis]